MFLCHLKWFRNSKLLIPLFSSNKSWVIAHFHLSMFPVFLWVFKMVLSFSLSSKCRTSRYIFWTHFRKFLIPYSARRQESCMPLTCVTICQICAPVLVLPLQCILPASPCIWDLLAPCKQSRDHLSGSASYLSFMALSCGIKLWCMVTYSWYGLFVTEIKFFERPQ